LSCAALLIAAKTSATNYWQIQKTILFAGFDALPMWLQIIQPLITGKLKKPYCLQGSMHYPCDYKSSKNTQVTWRLFRAGAAKLLWQMVTTVSMDWFTGCTHKYHNKGYT
jgi:hypothetical protein